MDLGNLLTPWLLLGGVLFLLVQAEKWIHSHLYGVGWLLTEDKQSATALYYLILFPGVFVHEVTQWLLAGALNLPTKRFMAWPEAQEDGTLRLDFVQIQEADWLRSAIVGAVPFVTGTALIWGISDHILNLEQFLDSLSTGDLTIIGPALQQVGSTPDFYLWLYFVFAISNAMLPTPADRKGWPLLIGIFAVTLAFLLLIGVGEQLYETFTGPVAHGLNLMTAAFSTVLVVEIGAILVIGLIEELLERLTKRKFEYLQPVAPPPAREPGSNLPLPAGTPPPSIYNLELPLPDPSAPVTPARQPVPQPTATPATPGIAPAATAQPPTSATLPPASGSQPRTPSGGAPERRPLPQPQPGQRPIPAPASASTERLSPEGGPPRARPESRPRPASSPFRSPSPDSDRRDTTRGPSPARPLPGSTPRGPAPGDATRPPDPSHPPTRSPVASPRPPAGERSPDPERPATGAPRPASRSPFRSAPSEDDERPVSPDRTQPPTRSPFSSPRQEAFLRDARRPAPGSFEDDDELEDDFEDGEEESDELEYIDFDDL